MSDVIVVGEPRFISTEQPRRDMVAGQKTRDVVGSGQQGPPGVPGQAGSPGSQGVDGADGEQGVPGQAGPAGAAGATGSVGPPGSRGMDGADGSDGEAGPPGQLGAAGPAGVMGPVGPAGAPGNDGPDGADGNDGPPGPQGLAGTAGATGAVGPMGMPGIDGAEGAEGERGVAGAVGLAGATGVQGPAGIPGIDGNDGQDGVDGPPGTQGAVGATGATGPQGIQGVPGIPGIDGADGQDGNDGPPGAPGAAGSAGTPGVSNIPGPPGQDGVDGYDGQDGPPGSPGAAGAQGIQGVPGMPGTDGSDGLDGNDGPPGAAGAVGATGATGATGSVGAQGPIGLGLDGTDGEEGMAIPGPIGAAGLGSGALWLYDTSSTSSTGIAVGQARSSNSDLSLTVRIYLNIIDQDGIDQTAWITQALAGSGALAAFMYMRSETAPAKWASFSIVSFSLTFGGAGANQYAQITVGWLSGVTAFAANERLRVSFAPCGNDGSPGSAGATGATGPTGAQGRHGGDGTDGLDADPAMPAMLGQGTDRLAAAVLRPPSATPPGPMDGAEWYDSSSKRLKTYDGSTAQKYTTVIDIAGVAGSLLAATFNQLLVTQEVALTNPTFNAGVGSTLASNTTVGSFLFYGLAANGSGNSVLQFPITVGARTNSANFAAATTNLAAGDIIWRQAAVGSAVTLGLNAGGWGQWIADAAWSNTSNPTRWEMWLAPAGTTTPVKALSVTSDGDLFAASITQDNMAPSGNATVQAGYSAIVARKYTIASGKKLTIASGAIFRIL